ncbi:putative short-chain dehydrogenase [Naviculisporaceae sp. PSN 640]
MKMRALDRSTHVQSLLKLSYFLYRSQLRSHRGQTALLKRGLPRQHHHHHRISTSPSIRAFSTNPVSKMPLPMKSYLQSQLLTKLPVPTHKFTSQTIIVTGSNTGIGLEAARYFVSLGAGKVILAVRDTSKGQAALESIQQSTKCPDGLLEVWQLDLLSYESVEKFAKRAESLERLDTLVANAGVYFTQFTKVGEDEATIVVNVISHMLLAMLLLPKMRQSAVQTGTGKGVITFTGSFTHYMTEFEERKVGLEGGNIFDVLADEKRAKMGERYYISKLMQLLVMREFASQLSKVESLDAGKGKIITSAVNPGFVSTDILRNRGYLSQLGLVVLRKLMARTAEEGARTVVHGATGDDETHGAYLDDCRVGRVSPFVASKEGDQVQKLLWKELTDRLEAIHPGIMKNL